jgi:hypothetical protein
MQAASNAGHFRNCSVRVSSSFPFVFIIISTATGKNKQGWALFLSRQPFPAGLRQISDPI